MTQRGKGRPFLFTDVAVLDARINAYFDECEAKKTKPIFSGLANYLDVCTDTLRNYEGRDDFSHSIKRAKQRVEMAYESNLHHANCTGSIFAMKNFGWSDTQTFAGDPLNPLAFKNITDLSEGELERRIEELSKIGA